MAAQQDELLPEIPASPIGSLGQGQTTLILIQLHANVLEKTMENGPGACITALHGGIRGEAPDLWLSKSFK